MSNSFPITKSLAELSARVEHYDDLSPIQKNVMDSLNRTIEISLEEFNHVSDENSAWVDIVTNANESWEIASQGFYTETPGGFAFLVTDRDLVIRRTNRRVGSLLHQRHDLLIGQALEDYLISRAKKRVENKVDELKEGVNFVEIEILMQTSEGGALPVKLAMLAERDADNELVAIKWIIRDRTEHMKVVDELTDSQRILRAIFDQAAVGIAHISLEGEFERTNQKFSELLGYEQSDLVGEAYRNVIFPEDLGKEAEHVQQLLEGTIQTYTVEQRYVNRDGETIWVRVTGSLIGESDEDTALARMLVVEDIRKERADERRLEIALQRTQDLYQVSRAIGLAESADEVLKALLSSSDVSTAIRAEVFVFDKPWGSSSQPGTATVLTGWHDKRNEVSFIGQTFDFNTFDLSDRFRPDEPVYIANIDDDDSLSRPLRHFLSTTETVSVLFFPLTVGGIWFGMLSMHYTDEQPLTGVQMTHIKSVVKQFSVAIYSRLVLRSEAKARHQAEQANEIKMRFLATISHELRTPLTSIKGFATTLLAEDVEWDEASQHDFITTISNEADKLTELIEQLLDLSRLEAGRLKMQPERTSVNEVMATVLPQLEVLAEQHVLEVRIHEELPDVYVDKIRIAQVISNLVNNAQKFAPEGSTISVVSDHLSHPDFLQFEVIDQGPGISDDEVDFIFDAFQRSARSDENNIPGIGLGLAISKRIIEGHGGDIWLKETSSHGTTLSFTVPVAKD